MGESGELAVHLSQLRFSTVEKLGLLAGEYAPGLDTEELQAFANAISGISESFCRWALHNPEIPRARILTYYRDFITSAITAAQQRTAEHARERIGAPAATSTRSPTADRSADPARRTPRRSSGAMPCAAR